MSKRGRQRSVESSVSVVVQNENEPTSRDDPQPKRRRDVSVPRENRTNEATPSAERPLQTNGGFIPQTYENLLQNELVRRQVLEGNDDNASSARASDDEGAPSSLSARSQRYRRRSASVRSANCDEAGEDPPIELPGDYCTGVEYDSQLLVARYERRERAKGVYRRKNLTGFDSKLTSGLLASYIEQKKIPMVERFFDAMERCSLSEQPGNTHADDPSLATSSTSSSSSFCERMENELQQIARDNKLAFCRLNWQQFLKNHPNKEAAINGTLQNVNAPVVSDATTAEPPTPPQPIEYLPKAASSSRAGIRQRIADEAAAIRANAAILNDYAEEPVADDDDTVSKSSTVTNPRTKAARADEDEDFVISDVDFSPAVNASPSHANGISSNITGVGSSVDAVNLTNHHENTHSSFLAASPLATQTEIYARGDPSGAPVPPPDSYLYRSLEIAGATAKRWMVNICSSYNCGIEIDLVRFSFEVKAAMFEPDLFPGLRWKVPGSSIGCSLFANGWIVCAGGQAFAENAKVVAVVLKILRDLGMRPRTDAELRIDSLTFGFEFSFAIRLSRFKNEHMQFTRYEPERFAGLIYHMVKPVKCTWIVFANGRAVLVGLKRLEDSVAAAQAFVPLAIKHKF